MLRAHALSLPLSLLLTLGAGGCAGEDGPIGPAGPTGPTGPMGDDGDDGDPGDDGINGVTAISLQFLGRYSTGVFDQGATEIVSYDPGSQRAFSINANLGQVEVIDLANPVAPVKLSSLDVAAAIAANTSITTTFGGVNSVAVANGVVATVIAAAAKDERGAVAFFTASSSAFLAAYEVGFLPDSIAFSPSGTRLAVANEGEPLDDYTVDPIGSVSIIDIAGGVASAIVTDLDFTDFDAGGARAAELDPRIRIFGLKAGNVPSTVAEDIEPEYVAFSADSTKVYVSLQENNAMAVIDAASPAIESLWSMGFVDHGRIGSELDASDRDDRINIRNWPVWGVPMPDTIATYEFGGETLIVTANEGDTRAYDGFDEEARIKDLVLDTAAFPDAALLQADAAVGRLLTSVTLGDTDDDGDIDRLFSMGARSFSIYTGAGERLFDSGNQFELVTAFRLEDNFNASNTDNEGDSRSDAKGCEPEALALGKIGGATFAFVGLERASGIMVYNISNPHSPRFVQYAIDRDFSEEPSLGDTDMNGVEETNLGAGDLGPESITFVPAASSPSGMDLLLVGNEISGTLAVYGIDVIRE